MAVVVGTSIPRPGVGVTLTAASLSEADSGSVATPARALLAAASALPSPTGTGTSGDAEARVEALRARAWQIPLAFEPVGADAPGGADFAARGPGYQVFVGPNGALLALASGQSSGASAESKAKGRYALAAGPSGATSGRSLSLVQLRLEGARGSSVAVAEAPLSGRIHRFVGSDPARWQRHLTAQARVRYPEVYPGIDVVYYGNGRELEYDFVVAPGASPERVRLRFDGVRSVSTDEAGHLRLATEAGTLIQRAPLAYQDTPRGRRRVEAAYACDADGTVRVRLGAYDARRPLVIDPILSYATLLGGVGFDQCWDIAVDASGAAFLTGETESVVFTNIHLATTNAWINRYQGGVTDVAGDGFVAKLSPNGTSFEWLTYMGGSDLETAFSLGLAPGGDVVVGGFTSSTNFPVTAGAYQRTLPGTTNRFTQRRPLSGFVTRLKSDGSDVVASTLLGGEGEDQILDLNVLSDGSVLTVGSTTSSNFPITLGSIQSRFGGVRDGFVARLTADLATLVSSTYLGGAGWDSAEGVAVDAASGLFHVVGIAFSTNFPTALALQSTNAGGADAFVAGFRLSDNGLAFSTYVGGQDSDYAYRAAEDGAGGFWVVGQTFSQAFPVSGGVQTTNAGGGDGFALRYAADGQTVTQGTFFGGLFEDGIWDVAVDALGNAHFAGFSFSSAFTGVVTNTSLQGTNAGGSDVVLARLSSAGVLNATFYGGLGDDIGYAVAADGAGNAYVAGRARSVFFPVSSTNVAQPSYGGGRADGFVLKVSEPPALAVARSAQGLELSWPAPNPSYVLESAAVGAPNKEWSTQSSAAAVEAGRHVIRLKDAADDRVFRLRSGR